jgi:glutamine amidotransferase
VITIIDYKIGNLSSVGNMLKRIGVESKIGNKPEDIKSADKLILPGMGSFDV